MLFCTLDSRLFSRLLEQLLFFGLRIATRPRSGHRPTRIQVLPIGILERLIHPAFGNGLLLGGTCRRQSQKHE